MGFGIQNGQKKITFENDFSQTVKKIYICEFNVPAAWRANCVKENPEKMDIFGDLHGFTRGDHISHGI